MWLREVGQLNISMLGDYTVMVQLPAQYGRLTWAPETSPCSSNDSGRRTDRSVPGQMREGGASPHAISGPKATAPTS